MKGDAKDMTERLRSYFAGFESVAVAYSGGVDSTVLAKAAYDALGTKALAITIDSPTMDRPELEAAEKTAREIGITHAIAKHDELSNPCFRSNRPDRCYYCKKEMLSVLRDSASGKGIKELAEGTNAEDIKGDRPGYRAVKEAGVHSPLAELGYTKKDVREMAGYLGLSNAEKPSMACLSSRIPYGTELTKDLLEKVSRAEAAVRLTGVGQLRVRCMGEVAVIEVLPEDFEKVLTARGSIDRDLKKLGFTRVALDLKGYSTGSMSEGK